MALTPDLVAPTIRPVPDEGPEPRWTPLPKAELDALVERVEAESGRGPIWIFAYGSLIWNPEFQFDAREVGTVFGWLRAFSLHIERWRASTEQPGLMMALERGGRCDGVVFRIAYSKRQNDLRTLLAREIRYREVVDMVRWVRVRTESGERKALTFWASTPRHQLTDRMPLAEAASIIAAACGPAGSCAQYLYNTVLHLEAEGIRDRNLWRLQQLVAEEIRCLFASP
ncbi:gamma-glutamylcyclotransferase [Ensifer aridi]|uniref:gamma-glutamylcyclotransferase n=1 Tax=Ensifer aridi TaxID=1708715 RepID=UPI000A10D5FE|nr:gamma-glutamylcyclotransferase [Ensifer aridi]